MAHKIIMDISKELMRAAQAIKHAKALIITAGAGMGVDSGLPDFRGPEGFWKAYPPLKKKGIQLPGMSNPAWFEDDPQFAWGFFGHRYNLYRNASPHQGFQILKKWAENMELGYFVFTSNVDGHFQRAGFDPEKVVECHGSIHYMQCVNTDLSEEIWPVPEDFNIEVDEETLHATTPLPKGPPPSKNCLARPNILMFGDWGWVSNRTDMQDDRLEAFKVSIGIRKDTNFVVIEIGAGLAVPTVRITSESFAEWVGGRATLIRINPREPEVPEGHISLPLPGLEALQKLDEIIMKT